VVEQPPKDNDYQFRYVWNVADDQKITLGANGATDSLGVDFEQGAQVAAEYPYLTGDARSGMRYNNQTLAWDFTAPSGPGSRLRVAVGHSTSDNNESYGGGYFYDESLTRDSGIVQFDSPLNPFHTIHLTAEVIRAEFPQFGPTQFPRLRTTRFPEFRTTRFPGLRTTGGALFKRRRGAGVVRRCQIQRKSRQSS